MKRIACVFCMCILSILGGKAQSYLGDWFGQLDLGGPKLKLVLHVTDTLGYTQASLDSPSQGGFGIVADTIYNDQDSIFFSIDSLNANFKGQLGKDKIEGIFTQNKFNFPLYLSREELIEENINRRPQDPISIDYYEENVLIPNFRDSIILAGTLTMPFEPGIKKAVILLSGSGPQNRNQELTAYNHRPFLVLSDYLTRNGIAVLRYDDRGVGQSTGDYASATTEDFMYDAKAAIDFMQSRPDLDGAEIGLIGHSEGGMIASMIGDSVDFLTLLGTPGTPIPQLLLAQSRLFSQVQGVPDSIIRLNSKTNARIYQTILNYNHISNDSLQSILTNIFKLSFENYPDTIKTRIPDIDIFADRQAQAISTNWFRYFINFKPEEYLSKVTVPVIAITGTVDLQVPYSTNLTAIKTALIKAGNTKYEIFAFEGVNHLFQTAITGSASEYGILTETFNEDVMKIIADWINAL